MKPHEVTLNQIPKFASVLKDTAESILAIHAKNDMTDALKQERIAEILNSAF